MKVGRTAHVYCGNYLPDPRGFSMFEEPPECNYEADVPLPECPEEDAMAVFVCPGCGATNLIRDHS